MPALSPVINKIVGGIASANGQVSMTKIPDMSRGREAGTTVGAGMFPVKTMNVNIPATVTGGTVQLEGSNGDPNSADDWHALGDPVTATGSVVAGVVADDNPWQFLRVTVAAYAGSGDIEVRLHLAA